MAKVRKDSRGAEATAAFVMRLPAQPPAMLTTEERAELEAGLVAARRGEFAADADVAAMYARHGLRVSASP